MPKLDLTFRDRAFSIDRESVNVEKRSASFIFATESAIRHWDWELGDHFEILDCSDGAGDLSLLRSGGPLLAEHDRRAQIGIHESAEFVTDAKLGRVGRATVRFGNSAKAKEEFDDVRDGIRCKFSVRYQPLEMVLEKTGEDGDVYRVTRWQALENSLVSMPADNDCQTTRDSAPTEKSPVKISNPHNLSPMKVRNRSLFFNKPDDGGGAPSPAPTAEQTRALEAKVRKEVAEDFTKRQREINDVVVAVRKRDKRDFGDLAQKMLLEGKGADEFARAIATSDEFKPFEAAPIGDDVQRSGEPGERVASNGKIWLPGDSFVRSEAFTKLGKKVGTRRSISVECPEFDGPRSRATLSTGLTSIQKEPGTIDLGVRRLTVKDLIAPGQTGQTTIRVIQEVVVNDDAGMVGEGEEKPEAEFDFEEKDFPVKKVAAYTKVSDELFNDFLAVASNINMRLPYMVELKEEDQFLNGDGTGNNLTGILNTTGILTHAKSTDSTVDALFKAMTKIRTSGPFGGGYEPDGFILNPLDWMAIRLTKDANGQYFAGGPFTGAYGNGGAMVAIDMLWGKPVVVTSAIAQGTALAGAFRLGAQYFQRQGMTIESTNTNEDDFIKNMMTIRAELRIALAVYRPSAFCQVTGLPAVSL